MSFSLRATTDRQSKTIVPTAWLRLARRKDRKGRLAWLAIEMLTEAQWKDGIREFGGYLVEVHRGDVLLNMTALAADLGCKRTTVRSQLETITADLGWEMAILKRDDPTVKGTVVGDGAKDGGGYRGGDVVGYRVTISDYEEFQQLGDRGQKTEGDPAGDPAGDGGGDTSYPDLPILDPHPGDSQGTPPIPPSRGGNRADKTGLSESVEGMTDEELDARYQEMVEWGQEDRAIRLVRVLARGGNPWAQRKAQEAR